jgi:hypothetical protein
VKWYGGVTKHVRFLTGVCLWHTPGQSQIGHKVTPDHLSHIHLLARIIFPISKLFRIF